MSAEPATTTRSKRFLTKWMGCANCGELVGQVYDTETPDCVAVTPWMHSTWEFENVCWYAAPVSIPLKDMMVKYLTMRNGAAGLSDGTNPAPTIVAGGAVPDVDASGDRTATPPATPQQTGTTT